MTARGELDVAAAPLLQEAMIKVQLSADGDAPNRAVVVDLTAVTFIDACALGILVGASERARERGTDVILRNPSRTALRLLEITALLPAFRVERQGHKRPTLAAPAPDVLARRDVA